MFWIDKIVSQLGQNAIINDSKTPSGRVHIGSLRGVVIHYMVYHELKNRGKEPRFLYGLDDYDPLDELPYGFQKEYSKYLGWPLSEVPCLQDPKKKSFADYYGDEFFEVFKQLKIDAEFYKMSSFYKEGKMDEIIEIILSHQKIIQKLYYTVSGSRKDESWYPLQVICENCKKIGTTLVYQFDGKEVEYICKESMVTWAKGCSYKGKINPYGGRAKLAWKLEWLAKWRLLKINLEGAGKDHSSKGGSRDISEAIFKAIFTDQDVPMNLPYEFFLLGKRKMSSSKGIGSSAYEVSQILPPSILRFLMIRYLPTAVIDFDLYGETIPKLFDEYDRCAKLYFSFSNTEEDSKDLLYTRSFFLSEIDTDFIKPHFIPKFSKLAFLSQIKGLNIYEYLESEKGSILTDIDKKQIDFRLEYVKKWLADFAPEDIKFEIQIEISEKVKEEIVGWKKDFLEKLSSSFKKVYSKDIDSEVIHNIIYTVIKENNFDIKESFEILYLILSSKIKGPKLGKLFHSLGLDFIQDRISAILD